MPNHISTVVRMIGLTDEIQRLWDFFNKSKEDVDPKDRLIKSQRKIQVDIEPEKEQKEIEYEFDFNKLIPRPEDLNIASDGLSMLLENDYMMSYNLKEWVQTTSQDEIDALTPSNLKEKLYAIPVDDRVQKMLEEYPESKYENFIKSLRNYRKYGHATWYDWSIQNWGTKWNHYQFAKVNDNEFYFQTAWSHCTPVMIALSKKFPLILFDISYADEDKGYNFGHYKIKAMEITDLSDTLPEAGSREAMKFACDVQGVNFEQWIKDIEEEDEYDLKEEKCQQELKSLS